MSMYVIHFVALLAFVLSASTSHAAAIRLAPTTPTLGVNVGDVIDFDLFLDTPAGLQVFGVAVLYDPDVIRYEPSRSDAVSYILYTGGKGASYLVPDEDPWFVWRGFVPPGLEQVNVVFIDHAFSNPDSTGGAAGTDVFLGNIAFSLIAQDTTLVELNFVDVGGTVFFLDGEDIEETVEVNAFEVGWVPEPTTALLVGLGLAGLGVRRRRWARDA